jgi:hypothetical protein
LSFGDTEQALLVAEIDFDVPAPEVVLEDVVRREFGVGAQ